MTFQSTKHRDSMLMIWDDHRYGQERGDSGEEGHCRHSALPDLDSHISARASWQQETELSEQ